MASEDYFARLSPPQGPGIFVQPAQAPAMPRFETGEVAVAEALVGAGQVVETIGVKWRNAADHMAANLALTDFAQKANELEHGSSQDPNYFIAPEALKTGLEDLKRQALTGIWDPVRRSDLDRVLSGRIIQSVNHASNAARSRAIEGARGAEDALDQDMLTRFVKHQGDAVAQASVVNERMAGIDKSVANGIYTAHAGEERKRKLKHETSAAQVLYDTRNDAAGTYTRLADPANYPGLTPTQREVARTNAQNAEMQNTSDYVRGRAQANDPVVRGIIDMTRPQQAEGLVTPGNINLLERPVVMDPETGKPATVMSMSFERDGQHILIPRVSDAGKIMTPEQAVAEYDRSGRQLGVFSSAEAATKYGTSLSEQQAALVNTPQGRALMKLPPHLRFRTLEGAKHDFNAVDSAAKADADRLAAFQRDTNDVVELIKSGADVKDETVAEVYRIQAASCARGTGAACKYVDELNSALSLAPHIKAAWQMDTATLGTATTALRGQLTAAGANPDNAQFKALRAFEGVLKEQERILKEEPVALGQKTRLFQIGGVDLSAAAAGDPAASAALANRGGQAEAIRRKYGGDGSPWLQSDLPQLKQQWDTADAGGKYKILAALRAAMPSVETYQGAVTAIGGDAYGTANMRSMIARDPELAKQVVRGGVILAVDKDAAQKAQNIRNELLATIGSDIYQPEQRRQAIDLILNLDAARRQDSNKLYDQNAVQGLKKAADDVIGPIEVVNGRRTPITPGIAPGNFASALVRIDERDVLRMGGAYDRTGRPIPAREIGNSAVLKPTEPGSSLYYVGMKRPTTEAPDGFMGFFDIEGRPLKLDMRYLTTAHPALSPVQILNTMGLPIPATTPARPPRPPVQRFGDFDFDQSVLADLRTQFPNESEGKLRERLDAVNRSMDTQHSQDMRFLGFLSELPTGEISETYSTNIEDVRGERSMSAAEVLGRQMLHHLRRPWVSQPHERADPTKVDPLLTAAGYWDVGLPPREKK